MKKIIIGVDGGGTRTTAAAVDTEGNFLGRAVGAGINFNAVPIKECSRNLYNIIEELKQTGSFDDYDTISIGSSALDDVASAERIKEFAGENFDSNKIIMHSDVHMALYGLDPNGSSEGSVMIVSGTGMMGVAANWATNEVFVAGGWGYLFGDEGSCFYIANEGIKAALRYAEKLGESTELLNKLLEFYNITDIRELIPIIYYAKAPNEAIASFAPSVLKCAENGDKTSAQIIKNAIDILSGHTLCLAEKIGATEFSVFNIGVNGGLFEHNPGILEKYTRKVKRIYKNARVSFPVLRPETSTILYALKIKGYRHNIDFSKL